MKIFKAYYTIIKYVPDLIKNEPINIGLIVHSPQEKYIRTSFSDKKIKNIGRYNKDIDLKVVGNILNDLKQNFDNEKIILRNHYMGSFTDTNLLEKISAAHSNQLQFSRSKGILTENLEKEFNRLFEELVYKKEIIERHKSIEERTMRGKLRRGFEQYDLIKNKIIKVDHIETDRFGGKIEIDFKYKNGNPNLIKNISLDTKTRNLTPLEYSKLWVKNFDEIKKIAKVEETEKKVQLVYCLPEVDIDKMNSSILDCLMEGADELIDYRDDEKVMSFIEKTYKVAHA